MNFIWDDIIADRRIELPVGAITPVENLAKALNGYLAEGRIVVLSCIGVQAVNQAVKAVAHANGEVARQGVFLVLIPAFHTKKLPDRNDSRRTVDVTVILLTVTKVPLTVKGSV